jgi:bacillopeptidase F
MKDLLLLLLIIFSILLFVSIKAQAGSITPSLESLLQQLTPEDEVSVIVSLREKVDLVPYQLVEAHQLRPRLIRELKNKALITQKPLKAFLKRQKAKHIKPLWLINAIAARAKVHVIRKLAARPDVAEVRLDYTLHLPETQYTLPEEAEWNLNMVGATNLWELGSTGEGIVVANVDTGVDLDHADLNSRWRGGTNSWYDPYGEHDSPYDADGHGTQTMGIMVGGDAGGTAIGVAPDANWIAVKIFNDAGDANFSYIHLGFQWLLDPDGDPDTDDAPNVVNNSWGIPDHVDECVLEFYDDIQALKTAGLAVVFAAGNEGPNPNTSVSPANYDNSYAIGSINSSNIIEASSSRGPSPCHLDFFPQVVAPGVSIKTSDLTSGGAFPNSYAYVSGTSFAAPHVSGAMVLLLSAFPDLSVSQLENTLILSVVDLGNPGPDYNYGYGLIDVTEAYELAASMCSADFDGDYDVDFADFAVLTTEWPRSNCTNCRSDLNGDEKVDFKDYAMFASQHRLPNCP